MAKNHPVNKSNMMQYYHFLNPEALAFPHLAEPVAPPFLIYKTMPQSPGIASPAGVQELKTLLQRLDEMDTESRELLKKLFLMLEKDAKLEKYIRRKLQDSNIRHIWDLIEQVLESRQGMPIHFDDAWTNNPKIYMDKGVRTDDLGSEMSMKLDRFKIKTLDGDVALGIEAKSMNNSNSGAR